jgi:hypothetical protein
METLQALLVATAVREQHLAFLAHQLPMLAAAAALQTQLLELAVQEGVVLALLELAMELLERLILAVAVVAQEILLAAVVMVLLAVLVLSSSLTLAQRNLLVARLHRLAVTLSTRSLRLALWWAT